MPIWWAKSRKSSVAVRTSPLIALNPCVTTRLRPSMSTHAAPMRSQRGQSTVEYVALVGCVAALLAIGATTLPASGIVAAAQSVFDRSEPPMASPAALAFVDAALSGSGPTINDAIERLGHEIGPTEARALVLSHASRAATPPAVTGRLRPLTDPAWALARAEFNGVGPSVTSEAWSNESPRATRTLRLVSADDELRWLASQSTSGAARAIEFGTSGVVSLISSINPATAAAAIVIGAGAAAAETASRGTPAGSREGDVIICRFVWRTNDATAAWIYDHPLEATRLRLGTPIAAVDIAVVRAGHLIEHELVSSHAVSC